MATVKISALTASVSVDAANDFLPIVQSGVTKKINRNTLLGVSGTPADISTAQSFTNKTLDNTNILTLRRDRFTLQDSADTTKQAAFILSGITTATTRSYTLPNVSDTLVALTASQTLTNKTLTSPIITGGTISNATITVDSIAGFSTSTIVSVGGVQMNNGTIGTAGAVVTASIADAAVTPNKLVASSGSGWAWSSWTPTWTNLTVGNGVVAARYNQTGKTVTGRLDLVFGTTSAVTGTDIIISLPVTSAAYVGTSALPPLGLARFYNAGAVVAEGYVVWLSSTTAAIRPISAGGTYAALVSASSTVPFTWATSYELAINFTYEAA